MELSEKIKELRESQGLSLMKLAKILNVSDASIFNWENGVEPKASHICALANYFQITTDELLCRENYGTGNVEIIGEKLSDGERQLVELYRSLDDIQQQTALQIMDAAFPKTQRKGKRASKIS